MNRIFFLPFVFIIFIVAGSYTVLAANGTLVWGTAAANGILNTSAYLSPYTISPSYSMTGGVLGQASEITFARIEAFYTRDEYFVARQNALGNLTILSCTTDCDNPGDWKTIGEFGGMAAGSLTGNRSFDIAIEETGGEAMVVFGNRTQLNETYYCIWNGTAWSPSTNCGTTFTPGAGNRIRTQVGIPQWITLTSRLNEILGVVSGTQGLAGIWWNGTEWNNTGNVTIMQHPVAANPQPGYGLAWENSSGNGLVVFDSTAADGTTFYTIFNGTTKRWGNATTLPLPGNASGPSLGLDTGLWIELKSDPNASSNRISMIVGDSGADAHIYMWRANNDVVGFTTSATNPIDAIIEATTGKVVATTWSTNGSLALFTFTDSNALTQDVICWNATNGFSASVTADVGGSNADDVEKVIAVRSPDGTNESFILRGDILEDLVANIWNGTDCQIQKFQRLPATGNIEGTLSVAADNDPTIAFDFAYQRFIYAHEAPRWSTLQVNETVNFFPNRFYKYNATWVDNAGMNSFFFGINQTGVNGGFVNASPISFNGTTNISNVTVRLRAPSGTVQWWLYGNDSQRIVNVTDLQTFTVTALNLTANATFVGTSSISTGQTITLSGNCTCVPITETCTAVNASIFDNRTGVLALSSNLSTDAIYVNVTNYFQGDLVGLSLSFLFNITANTAGNYNFSVVCNSTDGMATNASSKQTAALVVAVSDVAPTLSAVSPVVSQTITEAGASAVVIRFNVTDTNGRGNIDNASAELFVNVSNDPAYIRFNTTCENETSWGTDTIQFKCSIPMWYFDSSGNWTINASARDLTNLYAENRTTSFELQSTTAMVMGPTNLAWNTLEFGQQNRTATSDPIILNNTGNKNISAGALTVQGRDLRGLTIITEHIGVNNFSVTAAESSCTQGGPCGSCNGTFLFNGTSGAAAAQPIINANMTRGNNTRNNINSTSGQEDLFFCLMLVPSEISRQTYDTTGYGSWTVAVS